MVTQNEEKSDDPQYSLDHIRRCAGFGQVAFLGRAQIDASNLGYSIETVQEILMALRPGDFHKATRRDTKDRWADVYRCNWEYAPGRVDDLYAKIALSYDGSTVLLISLHRSRWT